MFTCYSNKDSLQKRKQYCFGSVVTHAHSSSERISCPLSEPSPLKYLHRVSRTCWACWEAQLLPWWVRGMNISWLFVAASHSSAAIYTVCDGSSSHSRKLRRQQLAITSFSNFGGATGIGWPPTWNHWLSCPKAHSTTRLARLSR